MTANAGTGKLLATILLALPNQGTRQVVPTRVDARQYSGAFYVQDDWKILPKLTLNFGLRYELAEPLADTRGQMASIDYSKVPWPTQIFAEGKIGVYRPTLFTCGRGGYSRGCAHIDRNNFALRFGLAWNVLPRTIVRAGAGIFYGNTDLNGFLQLPRGLPTNISQNLSAASAFVASLRGSDIFGGSAASGNVALSQAGLDINQRTSYSPQISFSIQRELAANFLLEVD